MSCKIQNPIFIIGPGRSGTTLLYEMLALHEATAFPSNWSVRTKSPIASVLSKVNDLPVARQRVIDRQKFWPRPSEAIDLWEYYLPGYREKPDWEFDPLKLSDEQITAVKEMICGHLFW